MIREWKKNPETGELKVARVHVHEPELIVQFDGIRWRKYIRCRTCLVRAYEVLP